jgi:dihydrofolate reductase
VSPRDEEDQMGKVMFDISMSLDGFVAGPSPSVDQPLGEGGERLHEWASDLATFQERHGRAGGTTGPDDDVLAEAFDGVGAVVMGRRMFGGGPGPWGDEPWEGWWGAEPPFRVPVFVVTHHAREPVSKEGGTSFTFVTDGVEAAVEQARTAAGERDVSVAGGADVIQQALRAGLVDEGQVHLVPVLLGGGTRLFEDPGLGGIELEKTRTIDSPGATHLRYRFSR